MTNEIERMEDVTEQQVELRDEYGSHDLLRFHRDLQLCFGFAQSLVTTPFVPAQYQGNPGHAAAAIMTARGVGIMDPMAALRSLDVIQGTPAFRANTLRALAQRDGHEIWVEEANSQRVIMKGRRKGTDQVQESMWDLDRARNMNLLGKDNWKKQPQAMLIARATSELVRLIAADTVAGLYSVEELADGAKPEEAPVVEKPKAPVKRQMRRSPAKKVEPAKPAVKPEETETVSEAEPVAEPAPEKLVAPPVEEPAGPVETTKAFEGDPLAPTPEEAAEWGLLPKELG